MTKEEKQLLLQDLCARLPYGVKCTFYKEKYIGTIVNIFDPTTDEFGGLFPLITVFDNTYHKADLIDVKPYLRPMSSMTEEEKQQIRDFWIGADVKTHATLLIDFYNKRHLDYRGLIPMGLSLKAPEGMYKF